MIRITRTHGEPPSLAEKRNDGLERIASYFAVAPPRSLIHGYDVVKEDLHEVQFGKCCYCEKFESAKHNPVEHYRPVKLYWWLSWTWANLMFVCQHCNGEKSDHFPLTDERTRLGWSTDPPGGEVPLIINPLSEDPMDSITFRKVKGYWWAVPTTSSNERARTTIRLLGLNLWGPRDLRNKHVRDVLDPAVETINAAMVQDPEVRRAIWNRQVERVTTHTRAYINLARAVLRHNYATFPLPPW